MLVMDVLLSLSDKFDIYQVLISLISIDLVNASISNSI